MAFDEKAALDALLGFLASEFNLSDLGPDEPIFSAGLRSSGSVAAPPAASRRRSLSPT